MLMSYSVPYQSVVLHKIKRITVDRSHFVHLTDELLVSKLHYQCVVNDDTSDSIQLLFAT